MFRNVHSKPFKLRGNRKADSLQRSSIYVTGVNVAKAEKRNQMTYGASLSVETIDDPQPRPQGKVQRLQYIKRWKKEGSLNGK